MFASVPGEQEGNFVRWVSCNGDLATNNLGCGSPFKFLERKLDFYLYLPRPTFLSWTNIS